MALHESFLSYRRYRWLKVSAGTVLAASIAYVLDDPVRGRGGGSWTGLALGGVSAALLAWLLWFGARKRRYCGGGAPLVGWLSAHVYLGVALLVLVPLHAAFRFGPNVHTLAYVLASATTVSGLAGIVLYRRIPRAMTQNRPGQTLAALFERIDALDAECRVVARGMVAIAPVVETSIAATSVGGGLWRQLSAGDRGCGTTRALRALAARAEGGAFGSEERESVKRVLGMLALKRSLLRQIRCDIRLKAVLDLWLLAHVPLAFTSVAAAAVHIFVVLYY
jgi:hypothetical protein